MSSIKLKTINEAGSPMCVSGVLSTLYGITVSNDLNVNSTSYISANSTFADTILAKSICSCATTPTLASHLANKGYIDSRNVQKGQLVYFYAFGVYGSDLATITLPPGTYKMKVDGIYAMFVNGGGGAVNTTSTINATWGSVTASNTTSHSLGKATGCGGYLWDVTKTSAVSSSFTLTTLTTNTNSLSITVSATVGAADPYSCTVSFYAA